jgi:uracil-DNA glycosylase
MGKKDGIRTIRGQWYDLKWFIKTPEIERVVKVFPTFHPSAVLRNRTLVRVWREDLRSFAEAVRGE